MVRAVAEIAGRVAARAFAMLPRRYRFAAARRLAILLGPLYRFTPAYRRRPSQLDGCYEELLRVLYRIMARAGVGFDPELEIQADVLPRGGALLVSAHFLLNGLLIRWLLDHGHGPVRVANSDRVEYYAGTRTAIATIKPGPSTLVRIRSLLRDGHKVIAYIDDRQAHDDWTPVETNAGTKYISDALMRFAERTGTPLYFVFTRIAEGRVVTSIEAAPSSAEAATGQFLERFRREANAVRR